MRLNSKVTWGLAWAGLAIVLAVPSADYLTGKLSGDSKAAVLTSTTEPVKAPTVTTTKTPTGVVITPVGTKPAKVASTSTAPVEKFSDKGKKLPDYISDNGNSSTVKSDTQVAVVDPAPMPVAPTPFPTWARPRATPAPVAAPAAVKTPAAIATPEPAVIVDESTLTGSITSPNKPTPPAAIVDDSSNWDTDSLRQYLERRGILEGGDDQSSATVTERSTDYDPDGFYMNDGPNGQRETRRERIRRMFLENAGRDTSTF